MARPEPIRADHRYVVQMINSSFKADRVAPTPEEIDLLCEVFGKAGGSWERLFLGSAEDVNLLRKVVSAAIQRGTLTAQPSWD